MPELVNTRWMARYLPLVLEHKIGSRNVSWRDDTPGCRHDHVVVWQREPLALRCCAVELDWRPAQAHARV